MRRFLQHWLPCALAAAVLGLAVSSCAPAAKKPLTLGAIGGAPQSAPASQPSSYDDSTWRALLLKHVGPGWVAPEQVSGDSKIPPYPALVDYKAIQAQPADLNAYMAVVARTGPLTTPQAFPTDAHRLAYYINAYNACAIRAVLGEYPTPTVYSPSVPAFDYDWHFQVDGQRVNLHDLRQRTWQAAGGDVRALFALCDAAIGSPPLTSQLYEADSLYDNLGAHMRDCLVLPQIVKVSHDQQQLQLWCGVIRHRKDFFDYYQNVYGSPPETLLNVMLELCPPPRRQELNKAVGYKAVEIPFDRKLNDLAVRTGGATTAPAQ